MKIEEVGVESTDEEKIEMQQKIAEACSYLFSNCIIINTHIHYH